MISVICIVTKAEGTAEVTINVLLAVADLAKVVIDGAGLLIGVAEVVLGVVEAALGVVETVDGLVKLLIFN